MSLQSQLARLLVGALALAVALTFAAPPTLAAPPQPIASAAAAKTAAVPGPVLAQAKAAPAAPAAEAPGPKPFLKTTKGALALALFAGAIGYTAYSFSHDRVHSPAR